MKHKKIVDAISLLYVEKRRIVMWYDAPNIVERCEAVDLAIRALELVDPEELLEGKVMNSCEYCKDSNNMPLYHEDGPTPRMDDYVWLADNQIEINLWAGGNASVIFKINYCPMCGRKLEQKNETR